MAAAPPIKSNEQITGTTAEGEVAEVSVKNRTIIVTVSPSPAEDSASPDMSCRSLKPMSRSSGVI